MVVEEYDEELNGEVQANNNQADNPSMYFIDLRIDDMKFLFLFFIDVWPVAATKMLIAIRGPMSAEFEKIKKKGQKTALWQKIANQMTNKNYNYTAKHCDEKWRRLLTRFRQVHDASKRSGNGGVKWQYYDLMQDAMSSVSKQTISPPESKIS
ncbi:trihelix transcription factor GT-1-like [Myzus persicae]|uniref:trihelix transcription factor GT-1-like n=1 Tax=Myzus persicae TaxID=13164 RepID=UPI000B933499|nr:trihelix transcription factor GT-1-like [Myzus persicae]